MGDNGFQHIVNAEARLGRNIDAMLGVETDNIFDLLLHAIRLGGWQVDFIQHWHNLVVDFNGLIDIGQSLRFHALAGIDHQKRAFASGQRAVYLIGKIHVARRVDKIELIGIAIGGFIVEAHGLGFNGDAALALDIHIVQNLVGHLARAQAARQLNEAVGQRRFAVVNMGNNREVTNVVLRLFTHGCDIALTWL